MSVKTGDEVVTAREFDITQYIKKLGVSIGVLVGATATALKLFKIEQITPGIVAAALGVTAVALLGVCLVAAVDIAARAYVTRGTPDTDPSGKPADASSQPTDPPTKPTDGGPTPAGALPLASASQKMLAWLEGESQPRLVLAVAGDGKASKCLLSGCVVGKRDQGSDSVPSLEGSPEWHDAKEVRAVKGLGLP